MVTALTSKAKYSNLNEPICYACSKLATYTMTRVHHITLADDDLEGSVIFMNTIMLITVIMGY